MPTLVHVTHDIELPLPLATIADIVHFGTILFYKGVTCTAQKHLQTSQQLNKKWGSQLYLPGFVAA